MNSNNLPLNQQKALVTGANSGIGEAVAKALAAAGATVIVNYVTAPDQAERVVDDIKQAGGQAYAIQGDVSDPKQVENLFAEAVKTVNTLDILVNNAGIQRDSPLVDMTIEQWQAVINVNLTGYFLCSQQAARIFIKQGVNSSISKAAGKIICISSVHQIIPWAGHCNYAASKGGVDQLMRTLAQELAAHQIRVNSIAPGAIKTHINQKAWTTPAAEKSLLELIPDGRVGEPTDIGNVAVWLASDQSDYVQGASIFVDGGMCLFPGFTTGG
ncbi:MAG: glucose 1-dehydrogenase [Gammaproteobacteria bacterium]